MPSSIGTAVEHHVLYQYQLANTKNIFMGSVHHSMLGMILPNMEGPRYHRGMVLSIPYYGGFHPLILYYKQYIDPI